MTGVANPTFATTLCCASACAFTNIAAASCLAKTPFSVTSKLKKKFPAAVLLALVFPRRQIARSAKRMRRLTRLGGTSNTPAVRRVKGSRHLPLPAAGAVSELWGGSYGSSASICRLVRSGLRLLGSTASTSPFHSVIRIVAPDCWPLLTPVAWWEIEPFVSRDVSHSTPNNR